MPCRMRGVLASRADAIGVSNAAAAIKKTTIYNACFYKESGLRYGVYRCVRARKK